MTILNVRESYFLSLIRRHGSLSRRELHEQTRTSAQYGGGACRRDDRARIAPRGASPKPAAPAAPGSRWRSIRSGGASSGWPSSPAGQRLPVQPQGMRIGPAHEHRVHDPEELVCRSRFAGSRTLQRPTLALGISTTGFVDPQTRSILTSSATQRRLPTRSGDVYAAAAGCPVVLENAAACHATDLD